MRGLPNNGRNFLSFMQLTPGVTIVQGPDGDEISVNGQKGINNNISVDGADFNNPFFGEQRGGQRPAFTFNQDAIKEMVVVADGAAPEFGRSGAGFVNVVTKSGTNAPAASAHFFFKADGLSSENSDGREVPVRSGAVRRDVRRPAASKDQAVLSSSPTTSSSSTRPSSSTRRASSRGWSTSSPRSAARTRTGRSTAPTTRASSSGKVDYQLNPSNLFTRPLQLHLERAAERHVRRRLVGPQRQRGRARLLERRVRLAGHDAVGHDAERVPVPVRARGSAAAVRRPERHRPVAPVSRHRVRLRQRLPVRPAVLHPGRLLRHARPDRQQPVAGSRAATRSRPASSSTASTRRRPSSASPTAATSSAAPTGS